MNTEEDIKKGLDYIQRVFTFHTEKIKDLEDALVESNKKCEELSKTLKVMKKKVSIALADVDDD